LFPGFIGKILEDTRKHEAHTMSLVRRYGLLPFTFVNVLRSLTVSRRLKTNSDRPDFLTRIIEERKAHNISEHQIAAHSSDFM
jgi:hypothetical protein